MQALEIWQPTPSLTTSQVRCVYEYIHRHIGQDLSLATLAQQLNMSPFHFSRFFRQATGESPRQYVLRERIERAKSLLKTTDTPLVDVATESGFTTQSYLTTVFTQRLGMTPRTYRRLVQSAGSEHYSHDSVRNGTRQLVH